MHVYHVKVADVHGTWYTEYVAHTLLPVYQKAPSKTNE